MKIIKRSIRKLLNLLNYDIIRKQKDDGSADRKDLEMYARLYSKDSVENRRFYNVGSGDFYHPHWTNLDYVSDWYKPYQKNILPIDLMKLEPLPIASGTGEIIYTSHTIEHIKDNAVQNLFNEAYRVLKPGGIFRVTTGPDADTEYAAMMRNDTDWFYGDEFYAQKGSYEHIYHKPANAVSIEERWLHHVASQLALNDISPSEDKLSEEQIKKLIAGKPKEDLLNYLTSLCQHQPERPGNHVSWWNDSKIREFMMKAGFTNVYKSGYTQSCAPVLRNPKYFDNTHPQVSVYVEAIK